MSTVTWPTDSARTACPVGTCSVPDWPHPRPLVRKVFVDRHLLVVDKPPGCLVHPTSLAAHDAHDVLSLLQAERDEPLWPVHRLDKGTSGLLVLARSAEVASWLGRAWRQGRVVKRYLALVRGWPGAEGVLDRALARDPELPSRGQILLPARTAWRLLQRHELPLQTHPRFACTRLALVQVSPHTGRRHQIRRHFKHLGHPLLGDATHGKGPLNRRVAEHIGHQRLWLHATQLQLPHPDRATPLALTLPPGPEWTRWLPTLEGDPGHAARR